MRKKSYKNAPVETLPTIDPKDIPIPGPSEEGLSGNFPGIGRGYSMPGEPTTPAVHSEREDEPLIPAQRKRRVSRNLDYNELLSMLVEMADGLDESNNIAMANAADFLIKKVAEQNDMEYDMLFADLLVKISNSDIFDKNQVFIEITKEYNAVLKKNILLGNSMKQSRRRAYQSSMRRAKRYVR